MAPTFKNIKGQHLHTAKSAFVTAQKVLKKAGTGLSGNIDGKMAGLLSDAFGIAPPPNTAMSAVSTIRKALTKIDHYFQNGTFIYIWNPPPNAKGFAAYTQTNPRRPEVFLTDSFFTSHSRRERAGLLVHEYVHLHHYAAGHPSTKGERLTVLFERTALGIQPQHSVNNAYCYQYFVEWLAADYRIP